MPNGDGFGFPSDFGAFFDPLLGVLAGLIEAIIGFLQQLVQAIVAALNLLLGGQQFIYGFTLSGLGEIFHGLKNIMDAIFRGVVFAALNHLRDLYDKISRWVKKLKSWLDKMRAIQQQYHVKAFRDFINMIQRIRRILLIFRLFHLKFATKLDNWLAGIEGTLIRREVALAQKTNEIVAWLNFLVDPVHGLTHLPFFLTAGKSLDGMLTLLTGRGIDFWYSKKGDPNLHLPTPVTYKEHYGRLTAELATGGGEVGAWRANLAAWQSASKQVG